MVKAHEHNYDGPGGTFARSWGYYWIHHRQLLARATVRKCIYCQTGKAELAMQKMASLPAERVSINMPPFTYVCLDLLELTLVKGMANKRTHLKVWPKTFVCQALGALHVIMMHNYGKDPFLLQ